MSTTTDFQTFLDNLKLDNAVTITSRYKRITKTLNKTFRNTESETQNSRQIGSMGRFTAIKGVSDLDMAYFIPSSKKGFYKEKGPSKLLTDVKESIASTYPSSNVTKDGQVVVVKFTNYVIEVLPCFKLDDNSLEFPDTNNGGSWRISKPLDEIEAFTKFDSETGGNLRALCKMVRAWKNHIGFAMGGLLIDTLSYNFLKSNEDYQSGGYSIYPRMAQSFFSYIGALPKDQTVYKAPGSNQNVHVKKAFQSRAKKAARHCAEAIAAEGQVGSNKKWKNVFGRPFPSSVAATKSASIEEGVSYRQTEEFIEDLFPIDIRYDLDIDCDVSQSGFRGQSLRAMLVNALPLLAKKKLSFKVTSHSIKGEFELWWKVLNQGAEAEKRDCIRGQIVRDRGRQQKEEPTKFMGSHLVEAYAIQNGVCVAKAKIDVPITTND
jgi:hypothetical protein